MLKEKMTTFFNKTKTSLINAFRKNFALTLFLLLVGISFICYGITSLIVGESYLKGLFFSKCNDLFMDFFNSVRDVSLGTGVYTERNVIYPPMANLIFKVFLAVIPKEYAATTWTSRYDWINYPINTIICVCFLLIPVILLFIVMSKKLEYTGKMRGFLLFLLIINGPMLYLLERGNIIIYAVLGVTIYAFSYDSNSKVTRELGLLALAFSFSLKLYPALFGWQMIADKRWKEAFRCIVYALLMLLIPSFFFGGPKCFVWVFENIFSFSKGGSSIKTMLISYANLPFIIGNAIYNVFLAITLACWVVMPFFIKNRTKSYTFTVVLLALFPSLYSIYFFPFFLPAIVLNINSQTSRDTDLIDEVDSEKPNKPSKLFPIFTEDKLGFIAFCLLTIPNMFFPVTTLLRVLYLCLLIGVSSLFCAQTIIEFIDWIINRKNGGSSKGGKAEELSSNVESLETNATNL